MKCVICLRPIKIHEAWGYLFDDEVVNVVHADCFIWEETVERLELEDYLTAVLNL